MALEISHARVEIVFCHRGNVMDNPIVMTSQTKKIAK